MKTAIKASRSAVLAGAAATLVLAAMGFAGSAQARDNVQWSVGVGTPGAVVNVGNAAPVYVQPAPVYMQPAPVYLQPTPVFVQPAPVYLGVQPVYYGPRHGHGHHEGYWAGQRQGYAPVYYQREGRDHWRGGRDNDWRGGRDGRDGRDDRDHEGRR